MRIVQVLNTFTRGDAITNYALAIKELLCSLGYDSEIYSEFEYEKEDEEEVKHIWPIPEFKEDDIMIYHLSINVQILDEFDSIKCRKVAIYHNVTPKEFFLGYSYFFYTLIDQAISEIKSLAGSFDYCIADSDFNRSDLISYGYKCPIDVLPIMIPVEDYKKEPNQSIINKYNDGRTNLLFVGRVVPNKKAEDVIAAFSCYKKYYNPDARLFLVGRHGFMALYKTQLEEYVELNNIKDMIFTGEIDFDELLAYYSIADVFLCMSEHEGFCVPLIEAMLFDVPVIAYKSTAIPGTLNGSGILLPDKDPLLAAGVVDKVLTDDALRVRIIEGQRQRLNDLTYEKLSKRFIEYLTAFIGRKV
jgi:glycosyltransferase involved in cell wall biosynthesis